MELIFDKIEITNNDLQINDKKEHVLSFSAFFYWRW